MSDSRDDDLFRLFDLAHAVPADQRAAVLDRECGGDADLRKRLEALIAAAADVRFLASPTGIGPVVAAEGRQEHSGEQIGRYKLLEQIGEGGFGVVFLAEQREPVVRRVALKIIKLGMDTKQVIARFEAERQALAMMEHPNIAKVLDAGATDTGRPYFVMELVRGDPITTYCDRNHLHTKARLDLFTQVCYAVEHAHQKGIIHRDIKPTNVLVTVADGRPIPKVIDFGIAKATSTRLTEKTMFTEHRALIGTPAYMSPEQAEMSGVDIDTRSDIYSLGVLLYELLTGTTPFDTKSLMAAGLLEIQRIIREVDPPKPSTRLASLLLPIDGSDPAWSLAAIAARRRTEPKKLGSLVRGELDWIVMKALEKDRRRRYETASGIAADIQRHLRNEPVTAGPPGAGYRVRKFVRRNRLTAVAAGVVALALTLGVVGTTAGMIWAFRERDRAEGEKTRAIIEARRAEIAQGQEAKARRRAEAVNKFLSGMLGSLDANQPIGREVSLRTILDAASRDLDSEPLRDDPEMEADVRVTLGDAYGRSLRDWYSAERQYARAAALREHARGPDDRQTLAAAHSVGVALHYQGRYAEAELAARQTLERRTRAFGEEDPDTVSSLEKVSWALSALGRFAEAEPLRVRAVELRRKVQGEDHPDTITSVEYLGNLYLEQGRFAEAEAQYRDKLVRTQRVYGAGSIEAAVVMTGGLAYCLSQRGQIDEVVPLFREALSIQRKAYGDRHRVVASTLARLGAAYTKTGRYQEAEQVLTEALDIQREVAPGEDAVAWTLFDLGTLRASQDRLDEAEVFMREGVEVRRALAASHGKAGDPWSLRALAGVLGAQGRQQEANDLLRQAAAIESSPGGK